MEATAVVTDALGRIQESLGRALKGLTAEELHRQPKDDCNSIAWLAWHLTRVQDDHLSDLAGKEQAWTADGWHAKFGMEPDPKDIGWGYTPAQVAAFRAPDTQTLLGYYAAVLDRSKAYLATLKPADRLYLYSDGLTETANPKGRPFGLERLLAILDEFAAQPLEDVAQSLMLRNAEWREDKNPQDDISLLGLEWRGREGA